MQNKNQLEAIIFDWAGTLVDFGSFAPTKVFVEAFTQFGIDITLEQARGPMGMGKWDHIRTLCNDPDISAKYVTRFGHVATNDDVTTIYNYFLPLQAEKVAQYSALIPGAKSVVDGARVQGLKIASCSGYPRVILNRVIDVATQAGLTVDCHIASDEVKLARPGPGMALKCVVDLGIRDVAACVKVDDTAPGISEGHNAGMWTVALLLSGNAAGVEEHAFSQLSEPEKETLRNKAREELLPTKPHFLIDTVADLPAVLDQINFKLRHGERPCLG